MFYDIDKLMNRIQTDLDTNHKTLIFRIGDDAGNVNFLETVDGQLLPERMLKWIKRRGYEYLLIEERRNAFVLDVINCLRAADIVGVLNYNDKEIVAPESEKRPALDAILTRHNICLKDTCDAALSRYAYQYDSFWKLLQKNKFAFVSKPEYIEQCKIRLADYDVLKNLVGTVVKTTDVPIDAIHREILNLPCKLVLYCMGAYKYELYKYDFYDKVLFDVGQMFIKKMPGKILEHNTKLPKDMPNLHFCWFVDPWKPSREKYLRAWQELGWHCVLWHSGQIIKPAVPGVELHFVDDFIRGSDIEEVFKYERDHFNHASCADLFRYFVLFKLGGAYADIDVLPDEDAKPTLSSDWPLFGVPNPAWTTLEIRFIFANVGHELLRRLLKQAGDNERKFKGGYEVFKFGNIIKRTGPGMAWPIVEQYAREQGKPVSEFLLQRATFDNTPDNMTEHYTAYLARWLNKLDSQRAQQRRAWK